MKKISYLLTVSFAALLVSCSNDDSVVSQEQQNMKTEDKIANAEKTALVTSSTSIILPDGLFFSTGPAPYGKAYFMFEGKARHIESYGTLTGLFVNTNIATDSASYLYYSDYVGIQPPYITSPNVGAPLKADNGLVHNTTTGKIYFREGSYLRYIPSMEIFNKYHFNMRALINTRSLSGVTFGPNIF
jgi:hypothetical protein